MSGLGRLARSGAWAHRGALAGTAITLGLAAALLAVAGVLIQTGLTGGTPAGLLTALAASFAGTVSLVVVLVVASTVSLALGGRQRDFALLRAVGATRRQVRRLVATEVLLVVLVAAPLGAVVGLAASGLLAPLLVAGGVLPPGSGLTLGALPVVGAGLALLPVAWAAARLATRETLRAAPSDAVRESAAEPRGLSRGRRTGALVLAVAGLVSAASPAVVPGAIGSASAGTSAFLLVGAAALAGPVLVGWTFGRIPSLRGAAAWLALANTRGFARRLTTAVVPLALALTAGTAQTTVDSTIARAATTQLADGLRGDLVVPVDPTGSSAALRAVPGVTATATSASVQASVRTDSDEDVPALEALSWEPVRIRVVDGLVDPGVVAGSLTGLDRPGTVSVSRDAALEVGGLGSTIAVRYGDDPSAPTTSATVVAVHDRGLGLGDYLVGPATARANDLTPSVDAVLLRVAPGSERSVTEAVGAVTPETYAGRAGDGGGAQRLSTALLLALLGFVVLAAANTLVMTTARRRDELTLLGRTGTTRRQLLAMSAIEAAITGVTAWAIGTVAVLPAVLGVSAGLLGAVLPPVDLSAYGLISLVVLLVPLVTMLPSALLATRPGVRGGRIVVA